jgi:hypothetical protein
MVNLLVESPYTRNNSSNTPIPKINQHQRNPNKDHQESENISNHQETNLFVAK